MDCTIGEELAEMAGQMRDHRNTVNNEKETATSSIEVTKRIRHEDDHGFRSLSNSATWIVQVQTLVCAWVCGSRCATGER